MHATLVRFLFVKILYNTVTFFLVIFYFVFKYDINSVRYRDVYVTVIKCEKGTVRSRPCKLVLEFYILKTFGVFARKHKAGCGVFVATLHPLRSKRICL